MPGADVTLAVDGVPRRLHDGAAVVMGSWVPPNPCARWKGLQSPPRGLFRLRLVIGLTKNFAGSCAWRSPVVGLSRALLSWVCDLTADPHADENELLEATLLRLLSDGTDGLSPDSAAGQAPRDTLRMTDRRVRRVLAVLRDDTSKRWTIHRLAQVAGLSRARFYDLFRQATGVAPGLYLDTLCLERAIRDLQKGSLSIGDVASDLGFAAQSHFTRFFKRQTGVTPREYMLQAPAPRRMN